MATLRVNHAGTRWQPACEAVKAELATRVARVQQAMVVGVGRDVHLRQRYMALVLTAELGDVARALNDAGELVAELVDFAAEALVAVTHLWHDGQGILPEAWVHVGREMARWEELKAQGAFEWCITDPVSHQQRLAVLAEEVGELVEAILSGHLAGVSTELVQVAAVALGWLQVAMDEEAAAAGDAGEVAVGGAL